MRSIMIALVLAAGFGLAGTSSTLSAPVSSSKVLGDLARAESLTEEARWCKRRCRHYRYSNRRCWRRCWW